MLRRDRHRRMLERAVALYLEGELAGCEATVQALILALRSADSARDRRTLGEAWECQARIDIDRGERERAIERLALAEEALEVDPGNREILGRVQYQLATELLDLPGYVDDARAAFARARQSLEGSTEYAMLVERIDLGRLDDDPDQRWEDHRDRLSAALDQNYERWHELRQGRQRRSVEDERERVAWSIIRLTHSLGTLLIEHGHDDERRKGIDLVLDSADFESESITDVEGWLANLLPLAAVLDRPDLRLPERTRPLIAAGEEAALRTGQAADRATVNFLWGIFHYNAGDLRRALDHALLALADAIDVFARSRRSGVRASQFVIALAPYQELALRAATGLEDGRLAGELIEASRPQVLPAPGGDPDEGDAPLGDASHVTVAGTSSLADAARRLGHADKPRLSLEDAITAVGGLDAWWWGSWFSTSQYFWAVRDPRGVWQAGHAQLDDAARAAVIAIGTIYHRQSDLPAPADLGPWTYAAERENARALAAMFLPPPLRAALATPSPSLPQIVIAGAVTGLIPLPTLHVGSAEDDVRLVERASLRIQPPVALVERTRANDGDPFGPWPVAVACLDPSGDLPWARHDDLAAEHVLVAERLVPEREDATGAATAAELRQALGAVGASANATFFYTGHVGHGELPGDLNTHLVLGDGPVPASRFFGVAPAPALCVPSRVILSACDSGGTSGSGSGEWFGLAGGMLMAGARLIVATAWPIQDSGFANQFERGLLEAVENDPDPARRIGQLQRDALEAWRATEDQDVPQEWLPTPAIFASYQTIGLLG